MHIRLLRTILCALSVTAPLVSGANAGIEVWAVSDSVRIDPVRNQPFEDNQSLFPDGIRPPSLQAVQSDLGSSCTPHHVECGAKRDGRIPDCYRADGGKAVEHDGEGDTARLDDKASLGAPGMWVHDPNEWERVHVKFGEAIEKIRGLPAEVR
jgi:hypothetical protein